MADGEEGSTNTPPNPQGHEQGDEFQFDQAQIGHQNMLLLQHMTGMIQNAMARMERMVDAKLSSKGAENHIPPLGPNDGNDRPTEDETPRNRSDRVSFKTFKGCGATEFSGTTDPIAAYGWLDTMEKVFDISHCWEVDRVTYAAAMFTGRALEWWNATSKSMSVEQRRAMGWSIFTEKFLLQYCPPDLQRKYTREFLELKQGTMSVTSYEAEFHRRSKFATQYITSERERIDRFVEGLRLEIRELVEVRDIPTLEKAAEYARCREDTLSRRGLELMPPSKRPFRDNNASNSTYSRPTRHSSPARAHNHMQYHTHTRAASQARIT